ncbi:ABC transporter permease [Rossellomorea marisflavi]|uniref:oligopeptide ABC transporter permease n=1 Tax=Rossellomorea marisflavi TaxID=189381 RepID=UPI003458E42D
MEPKKQEQLNNDLFQRQKASESLSEKIERPSLSFWQDAWIRLRKSKGAIIGMVVTLIIVFFAFVGPMMNDHKFSDQNIRHAKLPPKIEALSGISWLPFDGVDETGFDVYEARDIKENYWFGTDDLGRDLWTRTWKGTQVSLYIGVLAAIIDFLIGISYGGISGYYGGRVDDIMQRIIEIIVGIPNLIVVILFILIFEPGIFSITMAMVITGWTGMARIVRGQILQSKNQEYVLASRTLGASNNRLIFRHLLPNVMGPVIITTMFTVPSAIYTEAFLSFIGLGIAPPQASLGSLVNDGFRSIQSYPHMMLIPSAVISMIILSFYLMADGLRDALDPKLRK